MSLWIAYSAKLQHHQNDPHITLAYFPTHAAPSTPRHLSQLHALIDEFRNRHRAPFNVTPTSIALFAAQSNNPVRVLKISLPSPIHRLAVLLRDDLRNHGHLFDETYSFDPHITINPSDYYHDLFPLPNDPRLTNSHLTPPTFPIDPLKLPPIRVTSVFIHDDTAQTRTVFYLPR